MSYDPRNELEQLYPAPFTRLHERLLADIAARERAGDAAGAAELRALVESWWREQTSWVEQVREILGVHHQINNALVGVRGNTQLVLRDLKGPGPDVRERLEVVLRESSRIQEATARLRELKAVLGGPLPGTRAA